MNAIVRLRTLLVGGFVAAAALFAASQAHATIVPYCGSPPQAGNNTPHCRMPDNYTTVDYGHSLTIYSAIRMFRGQWTTSICSSGAGNTCVKAAQVVRTDGVPLCYEVGTGLTEVRYSSQPNSASNAKCLTYAVDFEWANCWKSRS